MSGINLFSVSLASGCARRVCSKPYVLRAALGIKQNVFQLLRFPLHITKAPFALSLSKGMSEWAQGFDKLSPNGG